jgi:hypothetical protein
MDYQNLTRKQLYLGEVEYVLDEFAKDFRKQAIQDWGLKRLDKKNNKSNTLYQTLFLIIVFTSQGKSPRAINEILLGKSTKELEENLKTITDMYEQEIKVLEGFQMKMFIDNIKTYQMSDSMNLRLLNSDFRKWFVKAMGLKDK